MLDEYIDRSRNMVEIVKRSKDKDTRILTVALELRNCLRGDAYDFARKLATDDHDSTSDTKGATTTTASQLTAETSHSHTKRRDRHLQNWLHDL